MKKFLFTTIVFTGSMVMAIGQRYEGIKNSILLKQLDKAKVDLDKNWENAKFTAKPEAYILKASLLAQMAAADTVGNVAPALIDESEKVYKEYLEKDPKMELLKDPVYSQTPITIYSNLFNRGVGHYNKKEYQESLDVFSKVLEWSEFLNKHKFLEIPLDTNAVLLAGAAAQASGKHEAEAMKYFGILADNKVAGPDNEFLYRYLSRTSFDKNDMEGFKKYMTLGKELYPEVEYYTYNEEDFVFSLDDPKEKLRRIEGMLERNPDNFKVQAAYGEILFEALNQKDLDAPLPENSEEIETKMVKAFNRAGEIDPSSPISYMNLANHFMNKSIRWGNQLSDHQKMMRDKQKANTPEPVKGKPAPKVPPAEPADIEKRKEIQKTQEAALLEASNYYEKSLVVYEKMEAPKNVDKQNWRNAISNLIDINRDLKNAAIRDKIAADEKKFEAQEKKYMAAYAAFKM